MIATLYLDKGILKTTRRRKWHRKGMDTQEMIAEECELIKNTLLQKNKEYGDSAINPLRLFSSADNIEQINVRIDDKLSRLRNRGHQRIKEDTILDLIGYLILRRVAERYNRALNKDHTGAVGAANAL